jgi:MFS family permease
VGNFPAGSADAINPYWITGAAVPSDMLLTKMWWPPVVALAGALWKDRETLVRWRPGWIDVPMVLWCLWPIGQWCLVDENPEPQAWIASLYLAAAWGAPWLLGRVYFCGDDGGRRLIAATVTGLAVITPIALVESFLGPTVYGWFYEPHPFRFDGVQRYVGFRPLAFFEDGNQYGIWVAATALAAIWLWQSTPDSRIRGRLAAIAVLGLAIALMSQSVGAILLLCAGLALSWAIGRPLTRRVLALIFLLMALGGAIYLSGALPLRAIAENTVIGRQMVDIIRSSGRGSFTWRIARDQAALPLIGEHLVLGTARWDWWRQNGERPWGLALLIFGQFGLIGLVLAFGSLLTPAFRAFAIHWHPDAWQLHPAAAMAMIVLMAAADALLNSFFFYPAILAAGALASDDVEQLRLARSRSNPHRSSRRTHKRLESPGRSSPGT